jgi:hypothetical protein
MSHWSIGNPETLTCASLIFASSIGFAAASQECSERYRICNVSCAEAIDTNYHPVCKMSCDGQLLSCDKTKPKVSTDGDSVGGKPPASTRARAAP